MFKPFKLFILFIIIFMGLIRLGFWQLDRAQEKKKLLKDFQHRNTIVLSFENAKQLIDNQFYQVRIRGHFDNQHNFLLDNKRKNGVLGFELITPFKILDTETAILVNRGFIPQAHNRALIPKIAPINGSVVIQGSIKKPSHYFALGEMVDQQNKEAFIIEYIDVNKLQKLIPTKLENFMLILNQHALDLPMSPEKHLAYAVQWFALALTLLLLCVIIKYRSSFSAK